MVLLFLSLSQMFMFFWTDIKDLALFGHLKGNDKIQKEDKISHTLLRTSGRKAEKTIIVSKDINTNVS